MSFTKECLYSGDIIRTRDGDIGVLIDDTITFMSGEWSCLDFYYDNLLCNTGVTKADIMQVCHNPKASHGLRMEKPDLLFDRDNEEVEGGAVSPEGWLLTVANDCLKYSKLIDSVPSFYPEIVGKPIDKITTEDEINHIKYIKLVELSKRLNRTPLSDISKRLTIISNMESTINSTEARADLYKYET